MTANELHEALLTLTACLRVWERDREGSDEIARLKEYIGQVRQWEREAGRGEGSGRGGGMRPYYSEDGITIYCADSLLLLPELAGEGVTFVYADPPYGLNVVKTSGVLAGRENRRGYVGGGAAYKIPFGGKKAEPTGTVGSGKPFGSKPTVPVGFGEAGKNKLIDCGIYAPVIGDDSPQTAIAAASACIAQWPKAVQVWWGGNYYANALPPSSCWLVWDKQNTGNFADAELAWCNSKTAVRIFTHQWNGLLKASERGERRIHPTQKPVQLASWCYQKYGKQSDVIFDPFMGSGSAAVAAKRLNRRYIGVEMSEDYCCKTVRRLAQGCLDLSEEDQPT